MEQNVYKTIYDFDGKQDVWFDRFIANNAIGRYVVTIEDDILLLKNNKQEIKKEIPLSKIDTIAISLSACFTTPIDANKYYNVDFIIKTSIDTIILEVRGHTMILEFADILQKHNISIHDSMNLLDVLKNYEPKAAENYLQKHIKEYREKYDIEFPRKITRYVR